MNDNIMKVAFQGEYGAYSQQAVYKKFGEDMTIRPSQSLDEVFRSVGCGQVNRGVVPVENSVGGSINRTYDLLMRKSLFITDEIYLPIRHCLLGLRGSKMDDIKRVYSHPQALKQCEEFLSQLGVEKVATYDTAGSAVMIESRDNKDEAAIAGRIAADIYGLQVLKEGIESFKNNVTRFLAISKQPVEFSSRLPYKTSITFEAKDSPGSLFNCLEVFASRNINLSLLHSRPVKGSNWKYLFYLDFEGHCNQKIPKEALEELESRTLTQKVLGSYPRGNPIG